MRRLLALVALAACLALPVAARADLDEALALHEAGDHDAAFEAFAALAAEENGEAMFHMARMLEAGEGVRQSRTKALTWYRRAAAHDVAEAAFRMGELYEAGIGTPRSHAAAAQAWQTAVALGHVPAMVRLAELLAHGSGAMPDPSQAARLLKQAADTGQPEAVAALATLVAGGTVPREVLDELGIPPPPPPTLPTVEEIVAEEMAEAHEERPADRLRRTAEAALSGFAEGESHFDYELVITEAADGSMVSTIRGLRLVMAEGVWEIGDIVHAYVPVGGDAYAVTGRLPETTTVHDDKGNRVGGTILGHQSFEGVYRLDLNLWESLTGELGGIGIALHPRGEDPVDIAIDRIALDMTMTEDAPGKWSGPARTRIEAMTFLDETGEIGRIDTIVMELEQRGIDYVFFQALSLARAAFEQRFGADPDMADPMVKATLEELARPVLALARERAPLVGDMGGSIEIIGISGRDDESDLPFTMDRVRFALFGRGLDAATGSLSIAYEHEGLAMEAPGAAQDYLPREMAFIVRLDQLPVGDGGTMVLELLEGGIDDPAQFQDNVGMALAFMALGLQQSMAAAGSTLEIERIAWSSTKIDAAMTGALVASASSPTGATGALTLAVEGLDAAVAELGAAGAGPETQELAMPLAMLQAMGQRTEENGTVRHLYVLELTPDGRTLLNGNDVGPMMDGLTGGTTLP